MEEQIDVLEDEQDKYEENEVEDKDEEEAFTYQEKSRSQGEEPHVGYSQESLKSLKYWSSVMLLFLCKYCSCLI